MPVAIPSGIILKILDDISAALALLDGAKVGLFKSDTAVSPELVLADLTVCDFSGYALSAAIVWSAAGYDAAGNPVLLADMKTFTRGAGAVSNDVFGYYIVDGAGTTLLLARRFDDAPRAMVVEGTILPVLGVYALGQPPDLGAADGAE